MYREILNQLADWKDKDVDERKVLLLAGARGVGKTYTLKDFGAGYFSDTCIFDFKEQEYVRYLFEGELNKESILKKLSVSCGVTLIPGETLLVFENVDVLENSSDIIDFLCESMGEYHVAITLLRHEKNFLENNKTLNLKLDIINIYPLSFSEFLIVNKENGLCEKVANHAKVSLNEVDMKKLESYLKVYFITGGMPAVVQVYLETDSLARVEEEKDKFISSMNEEIEAVSQIPLKNKIKQVLDSIPAQLEKENKKFQYGVVKITARARGYKDAVDWIVDHKYAVPLYRAVEPITPLSEQKDIKSFELFLCDTGILVSMFGISYKDIADISLYDLKDGALVEQYIFCELLHNPNVNDIYYWVSEATARIEFVFQDGDAVIPIEINLDLNEKAQSLKVFRNKYKIPMSIRVSKDTMNMEPGMLTLPLFSLWNL